jgi:phospho-N-acetylmuramoyl-pentapeptide-transferase
MISLMTSGGVALWVAVLSSPVLIRWLIKHNIGQQIREDGPQVHIAKAGTPTMGGIGIVAAVVIGYLAAHAVPGVTFSRSGALVLLALVGAGLIGFADDWIKVRHRRSLGLNKRAKLGAQIGLGVLFCWPCTGPTLPPRCRSPGTTRSVSTWVPPSGWCGPPSSSWRRPMPST